MTTDENYVRYILYVNDDHDEFILKTKYNYHFDCKDTVTYYVADIML